MIAMDIDFIAQITGIGDAVDQGRDRPDFDCRAAQERHGSIGRVAVGDAGQQCAGIRSGDLEADPLQRDIAQADRSIFWQVLLEPVHMERLGREGGGQLHIFFPQARHGEIPDDLALGRQHRGQGDLADGRHAVGHDMVQPGHGTRAGDQIFPEIVDLIDANRFPHGAAFGPDGVKRAGTAEAWRFKQRFAFGCEIVHMLHAIAGTEDRAFCLPQAIGGCGLQRATDRQFFIGVGDGEAPLIILRHFHAGIGPRAVIAKARDIHGIDIAAGLTLYHPFRQRQANTAALAEARHHGTGGPVIAQARHRTDQGIAVWREGEGTIDHGLDPRRAQHGIALERCVQGL